MSFYWAAVRRPWKPHVTATGAAVDLSHVHPFSFELHLEAKGGHPARLVRIDVGFSCHVFTEDVHKAAPGFELYQHHREARAFDPDRCELAKQLREIVAGLDRRKCFNDGHQSFVTLQFEGAPVGFEYRVYFDVRRSPDPKERDAVELLVKSAHMGPRASSPRAAGRKPVGFRVIVWQAIAGPRPTADEGG